MTLTRADLRSAVVDGDYRYRLDRRLRVKGDRAVVFCMLNPSTADGLSDDPTLRRCIGFANTWGFDRLIVVNLFAFRATQPALLAHLSTEEATGPRNDEFVSAAVDEAARDDASVICAWGAFPLAFGRALALFAKLTRHGPAFCLGETRDGSPSHPLYVAATKVRQPFALAELPPCPAVDAHVAAMHTAPEALV